MSNRPDTNVNTRVREQPVVDHTGQKQQGSRREEMMQMVLRGQKQHYFCKRCNYHNDAEVWSGEVCLKKIKKTPV